MKTLLALVFTVLFASQTLAQCTKDTDCKGDRICDKGACISPGTAPQRSFNLPNALNQEPPSPKFEEFPAQRHPGPWVPPKGFRRVAANEWRNEFGKLVEPPAMNFAGRFHIALNSCGTGCRYYSLTDLATGKDLSLLAPFASAEPPPKTKEGYTYMTDLISRPNSFMLIAQYNIDIPSGPECRERTFVLEGEKLRPVSNTRVGCSER